MSPSCCAHFFCLHASLFMSKRFAKFPEPQGFRYLFSLYYELSLPLLGTPVLHMCRYHYYSAHKTPQSHLKVVSCWNTLAASKLGSTLCRQHQSGPPFAHHIPVQHRMAPNLLLLHKPVPVIKTLNGSPMKGSLFLSRVVKSQWNLIWEKNDCGLIVHGRQKDFSKNKKDLALFNF